MKKEHFRTGVATSQTRPPLWALTVICAGCPIGCGALFVDIFDVDISLGFYVSQAKGITRVESEAQANSQLGFVRPIILVEYQ